jgi:peptidoglycan DL-endopeptidase CwlO
LRHAQRLMRVLVIGAVAAGVLVPATAGSAAPHPAATSVQDQIDSASKQLEGIVEKYNGVTVLLAQNKLAETKLDAQMAPTLKLVDAARHDIATIATQAYQSGPLDRLSMLVTAGDNTTLLDQMTTLDAIASTRQRQIDRYRAATVKYDAEKARLDNLVAAESAEKKSLAAQKAAIDAKLTKLYALRVQAYGSATTALPSYVPPPPSIPGRAGVIVTYAYRQLGKPYVFAAAGPGSFDCSGLVLAAYARIGIGLYHTVTAEWAATKHISRSTLQPGDLVFYESSSLHHVAIYIGGGEVIHAPRPGERVKISGIDMMRPWGYGTLLH